MTRGQRSKPLAERARIPVTEATLAEAALATLKRVDPSRKQLERKLESWVRRRGEPSDPAAARPLIDALLSRYEASGLVNDRRLVETALLRLRARGASTRAIQHRLNTRGLDAEIVDQTLAEERTVTRQPDLQAAQALVRRRRLGPFRPEAERETNRRRDLGILARAGFDFDTAARALATSFHEEES